MCVFHHVQSVRMARIRLHSRPPQDFGHACNAQSLYAAPQVGYVLLVNTRVPSNRRCNLAFMGSDDRVVDYLGSDGKHILPRVENVEHERLRMRC